MSILDRKFLNSSLAAHCYTGLIRPHLVYCAPFMLSSNDANIKLEIGSLKITNFNEPKQSLEDNLIFLTSV